MPGLTLLGLYCGCRKVRSALEGGWVLGTLQKEHSPQRSPSKNWSITKKHWYGPCVTVRGDQAHSLLFLLFAFALIVDVVTLRHCSPVELGITGSWSAPTWWWVVLCYLTKALSIFPAWSEATAPALLAAPDGLCWLLLWVGFPC